MDSNEILFCEPFAAAQSLKNAWTRKASTYGCINVVLSQQTLIIKPHWFVRWLISFLFLDLAHEIPAACIRSVKERGKWHNYGKVEVRFESADGKNEGILLYLKNYREFIEKISSLTGNRAKK